MDNVGARLLRQLPRFDLVTHCPEGIRRRPDRRNPRLRKSLGETLTSGQKSVARVAVIRARRLLRHEDQLGLQIAFCSTCRANLSRFDWNKHVRATLVRIQIDGIRREPHRIAMRNTRHEIPPQLATSFLLKIQRVSITCFKAFVRSVVSVARQPETSIGCIDPPRACSPASEHSASR